MSIYSIDEFRVWKGVNPNEPTWGTFGIFPSTRKEAEDIVDMLSRNNPDKTFRITSYVSQQSLDKLRGSLEDARKRVRESEGYASFLSSEIAEMKREAYRQGIELK